MHSEAVPSGTGILSAARSDGVVYITAGGAVKVDVQGSRDRYMTHAILGEGEMSVVDSLTHSANVTTAEELLCFV